MKAQCKHPNVALFCALETCIFMWTCLFSRIATDRRHYSHKMRFSCSRKIRCTVARVSWGIESSSSRRLMCSVVMLRFTRWAPPFFPFFCSVFADLTWLVLGRGRWVRADYVPILRLLCVCVCVESMNHVLWTDQTHARMKSKQNCQRMYFVRNA